MLSADSAGKLREALQADPSFINDVIKKQVSAIGVDTEGANSYWKNKLEPHYYDRYTKTVEDKDRVLHIRDTDPSDKNIVAEQALTYGENKTLALHAPSQAEAASAQAPEAAPVETYEVPAQSTIGQEVDQQALKFWTADYDAQVAGGASKTSIVEDIENQITSLADIKYDPASSPEEKASAESLTRVLDVLHVQYKAAAESERQQAAVTSAQNAVEAVHDEIAATQTETVPKLNGEPVRIINRYNDSNGNEWVELASGRQIKASQLDK